MNDDEKQEIKDPREIGTRGLSGLSRERPDGLHFGRSAAEYKTIQSWENQNLSPVQYLGDIYTEAGKSKYDTQVHTLSDLENLQEFRAQVQPWYDQIANGALKMVTTAATTFVDGTIGSLYGIGQGIYNLADDDPTTGFWKGMWNNAITKAMSNINDKMEEAYTNYRSEWEENASVFERMFSAKGAANFWGDDILKNAGFTLGAAASIWATGSVGGLLKAPSWGAKIGKGIGLLTKGAEGLELTKAGKVASWLTNTFVSTQGEASIEALNSTKESLKALDAEVDAMTEKGYREAAEKYQDNVANGMSELEAKAIYNDTINTLNRDIAAYKDKVQTDLGDIGNMIYAANIAALSVSNNLTLGSMIRGGYGSSKSLLNQAIKTAEGKPINNVEEAAKALLKGKLRFEAPKVDNATAKIAGHWALTSTQEGLEEGVQNIASNTGQILASARGHKWAKENTMLDHLIDSDAGEDLATYSKAMGKAFEDQFGKLNSPGWTEVVAGFITGALGVPGVHTNKKGQLRPTMRGGIMESIETINGNRDAVAQVADQVNQALTSNKFVERAKHAVEQIAIKKDQDAALEAGDIRVFKNLEIQQLLSDAVFFRDMGMLDDYLGMYKEMANGLSDEDLAELKAAAKEEDGEKSALELKPDDEIRQLYQDKAKSTLDKINVALKDYEALEARYGDNFSDETRREALMEMSYLDLLYWDTQRRRQEVQDEVDELINNPNRTPLQDLTLQQQLKAATELENQALELRRTLNEYKESPNKLQEKVEKRQLERQKIELYKQANAAIEKYKQAETLQDITDVYYHSPEDNREKVLDQAIAQSEGETKVKLQQFRDFMGDVSAIEQLITDRFLADDSTANVEKAMAFGDMVRGVVKSMLEDESPVLNRASLKDKIKEIATRVEDKWSLDKIEMQGESSLDNAYADLLTNLNYFIDSLDKLDELKKAGKTKEAEKVERRKSKKEIKKEAKKIEGEHVDVVEEDIEGEEEDFDDDSEEEASPKKEAKPATKKTPLLTDEEQQYYGVKQTPEESGISYNRIQKKTEAPKKVKDALAKKLNGVKTKLDYLEKTFGERKEKDKPEVIEEILDVIKNNILDRETVKAIDKFLAENKKYMKPASGKENALPAHDNKTQQSLVDSDVSLNGTQHTKYVMSELTKNGRMVEVTYQKSGKEPLQIWLNESFNTQHITDTYLGKVIQRDSAKKVQDRTAIHYLKDEKHPDVIFLGIKYSEVEDIIPADEIKRKVTPQDGQDYIIVGTLGWDGLREGTKDMYDTILDSFEGNEYNDGWTINTEHTNRIKDIEEGFKVSHVGNEEVRLEDLKDLLASPSRNPRRLTIDDFSWTVIEGTDEHPTRKIINGDPATVHSIQSGGLPGQVYLNIPTSNGKSIPVAIETLSLSELQKGTPLDDEITRLVGIIADTNNTMQDKKAAIASLNDLVIFAPGINQLHVNDESFDQAPNTIAITKNGQSSTVIDFNIGEGLNAEELLAEVIGLNPRINLSTSVLDRDPSIYLNSGVLQTDIAVVSTVGSRFFVYPVDDEGNYVENKPFKGTGKVYDSSVRNKIYIGGKAVYYDGNKFTNINGDPIEDTDGTLAAALKIKEGKIKPTKLTKKSKVNYYIVDDTVYVDNGHGGLNIVDEDLKEKVLSVASKKEDADAKETRVRKEAARIKKKEEIAPLEEGETEEEEEKPTPPVKKGKQNFTNGTNIDEVKSYDDIRKEINSNSFTAVLNKRENRVKRGEICSLIKSKLGIEVNNVNQIMEVLLNPEYQIDLTSNNIDTVIDQLQCVHK